MMLPVIKKRIECITYRCRTCDEFAGLPNSLCGHAEDCFRLPFLLKHIPQFDLCNFLQHAKVVAKILHDINSTSVDN